MFDVVVVYLVKNQEENPEVLLGLKGRGLGVGRIVGPGVKVTPGEAPIDAAIREVQEEVGVTLRAKHLHHRATVTYPFSDRPQHSQRSFVFTATRWEGDAHATEELDPAWYPLDQIPWSQMWDDAKLWLPQVLAGTFIEATFTIGRDDTVVHSAWSDTKGSGIIPGR